MKYDYTLAPNPVNDIFEKQCVKLKSNGFVLVQELVDVDGSIIRSYQKEKCEAQVWLDYYVGAVYMKSNAPCDDVLFVHPLHVDIA